MSTWKPRAQEVPCKCSPQLWSRKCVRARNLSGGVPSPGLQAWPENMGIPPPAGEHPFPPIPASWWPLCPQCGPDTPAWVRCPCPSCQEPGECRVAVSRCPRGKQGFSLRVRISPSVGRAQPRLPRMVLLSSSSYAGEQKEALGGKGGWPAGDGGPFLPPASPMNTQSLCAAQNPL